LKKSDNANISKKELLILITHFCSREERCAHDVRKKISELGLPENEIPEIIEFLKKEKYIDENRFAAAFVNDKYRFNKWGKYKINFALKQKHIHELIISEALAKIPDENYHSLLRDEISKKLRSLPKSSGYELKSKLYRFAASRGYENDLILEVIDELLNEN
jgi:regulatory protein